MLTVHRVYMHMYVGGTTEIYVDGTTDIFVDGTMDIRVDRMIQRNDEIPCIRTIREGR